MAKIKNVMRHILLAFSEQRTAPNQGEMSPAYSLGGPSFPAPHIVRDVSHHHKFIHVNHDKESPSGFCE